MERLLCLLWAAAAQATATQPCPSSTAYPWCDPATPLDRRIDLLLTSLQDDELPALLSNSLFKGTTGVKRLNLPKYVWISEADHGLLKVKTDPLPTSFPQVGLIGATFNRSLFHAIGVATAREAFLLYVQGKQDGLLLHNNINIFRDPRWGRGQETPGEDPFLNGKYAEAWVQGIQKIDRGRTLAAAACKHFAAYSFEGVVPKSRHSFDAVVTPQDLADTYLPAFEACVKAGAKGLMCSYNAINGTPACANKGLLTDVARSAWGFDGVIVTDCDAVADLAPGALYDSHVFVMDRPEASYVAMDAGVDVDCGAIFKDDASLLTRDMLRTAVKRTLKVRFELGEFDQDNGSSHAMVDWEAHKRLARDTAVQGIVMLKNLEKTLPLRRNIKLAAFGPLANSSDDLLGDYSPSPVKVLRFAEGVRPYVQEITIEKGMEDICSKKVDYVSRPDADVVIVFAGLISSLGGNPDAAGNVTECVNSCLEGEGCDRRSLRLPEGQAQLIRRAASWGLPLVLVVVSGGPVDLDEFSADPNVHSIFWTGYPGQEAGAAVAALLFGEDSPSGRLPITFYRGSYAEAVPIESMAMRADVSTGRPGRTYRFVEARFVTYPFGYGLSFDSWQLFWLPMQTSTNLWSTPLRVEASVAGAVQRTGGASLVVLMFLKPPASVDSSAPLRQLRGFERIHLVAGQRSTEILFQLQRSDFELVNPHGEKYFEPGRWLVEINAPVQLSMHLDVTSDACFAVASSAGLTEQIVV